MTNNDLIKKYCIDPTLAAKANNLSCREGTLYSYAEPIAKYLGLPIECGTEEPVFIVSRRKWSVTTSRHQNTVIGGLATLGIRFDITEERLSGNIKN